MTIPFVLIALLLSVVVLMPREVTILFGGSERLVPYVADYLRCAAIGILMCVPLFVGMFVVRLDGSPNFAMMVNIINSLLNIGLDYLFVFPLEMGIKGGAIATSMASTVSALVMMGYFVFRSRQIRFYHPKFSHKAIRLTMRNAGYMVKLGVSTFLGETALSCMMIVGNYMFMSRLQEDGVAAFSVACYLFPLVFMVGNAIAQSALPIISYYCCPVKLKRQ